MVRRASASFAALALTALCASCSDRVVIARDTAGANGGADGGSAGSVAIAGAGGNPVIECRVTTCLGKVYRCGDCLDNDGDGLSDTLDSECTGPCDDTEDSFFSGVPGANNAPCREDCYFDQDTGAGNDDCYWSQRCDPQSVAPDYPPSGDASCAYDASANISGTAATCEELETAQSSRCLDYCGPLVPNGCDAFGCCELPAGSARFVWLGSTQGNLGSCTEATLADASACHPCTPVQSAFNRCDECELCVGKPRLPAQCSAGEPRCPAGLAACGQPLEPACDAGFYCVTGCCVASPK